MIFIDTILKHNTTSRRLRTWMAVFRKNLQITETQLTPPFLRVFTFPCVFHVQAALTHWSWRHCWIPQSLWGCDRYGDKPRLVNMDRISQRLNLLLDINLTCPDLEKCTTPYNVQIHTILPFALPPLPVLSLIHLRVYLLLARGEEFSSKHIWCQTGMMGRFRLSVSHPQWHLRWMGIETGWKKSNGHSQSV